MSKSVLYAGDSPVGGAANFFSGAAIQVKKSSPIFNPKIFERPPVICGLNRVKVKKSGSFLLSAKPLDLRQKGGRLSAGFREEFPLLVVNQNPASRTAAFTCDFAPIGAEASLIGAKRPWSFP